MLQISPALLDALTMDSFLGRLWSLLSSRCGDPLVRAQIVDRDACFAFWRPRAGDIAEIDEHALAVRLAYLLACRAHDADPALAQGRGEAVTIAMKQRLEDWRVLAFGDFEG